MFMGEKEFDSFEATRDFIRYQLPKEQNGEYWYQQTGIDSKSGILVIFQIKGCLIDSGIFRKKDSLHRSRRI